MLDTPICTDSGCYATLTYICENPTRNELHGTRVAQIQEMCSLINNPDSKVHGANMGPIWCLQDPEGGRAHIGPVKLAIREIPQQHNMTFYFFITHAE